MPTLLTSKQLPGGGVEIAQSLASRSTKPAVWVRARLDPLVLEGWNSFTVLLTRSHQCRRLVQKRRSMCYYVCNNAYKRSLAICRKSRASCPVSRLLSVPIWPACAKQGRWYDSNKKNPLYMNVSDPCEGLDCQNGGVCEVDGATNTVSCVCPAGFTGPLCQDPSPTDSSGNTVSPTGGSGGFAGLDDLSQALIALLCAFVLAAVILVICLVACKTRSSTK